MINVNFLAHCYYDEVLKQYYYYDSNGKQITQNDASFGKKTPKYILPFGWCYPWPEGTYDYYYYDKCGRGIYYKK